MKSNKVLIIVGLFILFLGISLTSKENPKIVDVSWPNCHKKLDYYSFGIIGVNGGRDFTKNPCLPNQLSNFHNFNLYINSGYPGRLYGIKYKSYPLFCNSSDNYCLAYNYGFNAASYAIKYADLNNAHSSQWWIDVETENSWTDNFLINRQFLLGEINALKNNILFSKIGIYSTNYQWQQIMGVWDINLNSWIGTGSKTKYEATIACQSKSFSGGRVIFAQYTPSNLDYNVRCS